MNTTTNQAPLNDKEIKAVYILNNTSIYEGEYAKELIQQLINAVKQRSPAIKELTPDEQMQLDITLLDVLEEVWDATMNTDTQPEHWTDEYTAQVIAERDKKYPNRNEPKMNTINDTSQDDDEDAVYTIFSNDEPLFEISLPDDSVMHINNVFNSINMYGPAEVTLQIILQS